MVFIGFPDALDASLLIDLRQIARVRRVKIAACTEETGAARQIYYMARNYFPWEKVRIAPAAGIASAEFGLCKNSA